MKGAKGVNTQEWSLAIDAARQIHYAVRLADDWPVYHIPPKREPILTWNSPFAHYSITFPIMAGCVPLPSLLRPVSSFLRPSLPLTCPGWLAMLYKNVKHRTRRYADDASRRTDEQCI